MSEPAPTPGPATRLPRSPDEDTWRRMSPAARERFLQEVLAALSAEAELMSESRPHSRAKSKTLDKLGQHFRLSGRRVYLASELAVVYPGETPFCPDILAVLDVEDPGDADERSAWVVADEGKGLDLVIEILHKGSESKDLVDNVERYARLGVPEYFVYDRRRQALRGYQLASAGARRYREVRPHFGRYPSAVLGLDLAVIDGRLRLFHGAAEVVDSEALIAQLGDMVDDLERRRDEAEDRAQAAQDQAQAAQARAEAALHQLRAALHAVLASRGLTPDDAQRAHIEATQDAEQLQRFIVRALSAGAMAEVLREG